MVLRWRSSGITGARHRLFTSVCGGFRTRQVESPDRPARKDAPPKEPCHTQAGRRRPAHRRLAHAPDDVLSGGFDRRRRLRAVRGRRVDGAVASVAHRVTSPFVDSWHWTTGLIHARDQTAKLKQLEARVGRDASTIKQLQTESHTYQQLAHWVQQNPQFHSVSGSAIAQSPESDTPSVMLGIGSYEGVQVNDPVIAPVGTAARSSAAWRTPPADGDRAGPARPGHRRHRHGPGRAGRERHDRPRAPGRRAS